MYSFLAPKWRWNSRWIDYRFTFFHPFPPSTLTEIFSFPSSFSLLFSLLNLLHPSIYIYLHLPLCVRYEKSFLRFFLSWKRIQLFQRVVSCSKIEKIYLQTFFVLQPLKRFLVLLTLFYLILYACLFCLSTRNVV